MAKMIIYLKLLVILYIERTCDRKDLKSYPMSKFPPEFDKHPLSGGLILVLHPIIPKTNPSMPSIMIRRTIHTKPIPPYHLNKVIKIIIFTGDNR